MKPLYCPFKKKTQMVLLSLPCRGQELSLGSVIFINYIFFAGGTKLHYHNDNAVTFHL